MKYILLIGYFLVAILFVVATCVKGEESETEITSKANERGELIKQLASDDFDLREKATAELSKMPYERLQNVLELRDRVKDNEVKERLKTVAYNIFVEYDYNHNPNILKFRTSLELDCDLCYVHINYKKPLNDDPDDLRNDFWNIVGERATAVHADGPCDGILKENDILIKINGKKIPQDRSERVKDVNDEGEAGKALKFMIIRPKEGIKLESNADRFDINEGDFEIKTVELTPILVDMRKHMVVKDTIEFDFKRMMETKEIPRYVKDK